jgi:hypothetical protein
VFDGTTTVSVTGTAAFSGLVNGQSFTPSGTVTWAFADANVGNNKSLTRTGTYSDPSANYTVTQPTLTASITKATPTITTAPTASNITSGQALSSSILSGGAATGVSGSLAGSFAFTTPATTPAVGTASQSVTFTPSDTTNYNTATTNVNVTVESGVPAQVTLSRAHTPINGGFTVAWTDVANETGYLLQHSTNATFASGVTTVNITTANTTSHDLTGLANGNAYYVRVLGYSAGGNGTWSATQVNQLNSLAANATTYLSVAGEVSAYTVAGIFGAANAAGLAAGTNDSNSTNILLLSDSGSTANTIFYSSSASGWREGSTDRASTAIPQGTAFMLRNRSGSTDYFLLAAAPRTANLTVSVNATNGQVNLLTPARSTATALSALNLRPGTANSSNHIKEASTATASDLIIIPQASGRLRGYFHDGSTWRTSGGAAISDPTAVTVPAGGAFFIRKASGSNFNSWTAPSE